MNHQSPVRVLAGVLLLILAGCGHPEFADESLTRWYARPADMVSRVAAQVLMELRFRIERDEHDETGGEIEATEAPPGKRELILRFRSVDKGTRVAMESSRNSDDLILQVFDQISDRLAVESVGSLTPPCRPLRGADSRASGGPKG